MLPRQLILGYDGEEGWYAKSAGRRNMHRMYGAIWECDNEFLASSVHGGDFVPDPLACW